MASARPATRVLLVEDHPVNQKVVSKLLERLHCQVHVADDGARGVEQAREGYDLILMDCSMPRMDGFEATRQIRSLSGSARATPIVALTAHATEGDRARCLAAGMNAWIAKPVSRDQLADALREHTDWSEHSTVPTPGLLDEDTVATLLGLGGADDPDFFSSLVRDFEGTARDAIASARRHLKDEDPTDFGRALHRLSGSAGTIGAARVREALLQIRTWEGRGAPAACAGALDDLEREVDRALDELRLRQPKDGSR